ncbi:MAG: hypothetical protein M3198_17900, partial [Actinomycetota bacterium]|nr:hypothetical protein [Actinomycetota bacterium]
MAIVFLTFGYLLVDAFAGKKLGALAAWGLALAAFFAYVLALMLVHIVASGRFLSSPWLVRTVTLMTFLGLVSRKVFVMRRRAPAPGAGRSGNLVALGVLLVAALA